MSADQQQTGAKLGCCFTYCCAHRPQLQDPGLCNHHPPLALSTAPAAAAHPGTRSIHFHGGQCYTAFQALLLAALHSGSCGQKCGAVTSPSCALTAQTLHQYLLLLRRYVLKPPGTPLRVDLFLRGIEGRDVTFSKTGFRSLVVCTGKVAADLFFVRRHLPFCLCLLCVADRYCC